MEWAKLPAQFGAIHFHDDDLYDAAWSSDFAFTVPADLRSGFYAVRLRTGPHEDYVPFFVVPPRGVARAPLAFLAPTASYMAYANDHGMLVSADAELGMGRLVELQPQDFFLGEHPEFGRSLYDTHSDESGVCYSSRLRPMLNQRPKYQSWNGGIGSSLWQYNADTHVVKWLEDSGQAYDVITDEELHTEGLSLLRRYRAVMTGTHPEYYSTAMLDALQAYTDQGGRLIYLGANGFYWRIAYHRELPGVIEVRRAEGGCRTWRAEPGEYYMSFTGEHGGLWLRQGRPPQLVCGVGFSAEGFDLSSYYRRLPDSHDRRAAFIFEGIGADERIGDFGLIGGGAAGLEIDRADRALGTPPHALVLATSEGHTDNYLIVPEDVSCMRLNITGSTSPLVRADLVFYETMNGGAVFSTGSIAWAGSLLHNGGNNNVARVTSNVLRRFLSEEPFVR
jgi:N,N-dimethylformamidase